MGAACTRPGHESPPPPAALAASAPRVAPASALDAVAVFRHSSLTFERRDSWKHALPGWCAPDRLAVLDPAGVEVAQVAVARGAAGAARPRAAHAATSAALLTPGGAPRLVLRLRRASALRFVVEDGGGAAVGEVRRRVGLRGSTYEVLPLGGGGVAAAFAEAARRRGAWEAAGGAHRVERAAGGGYALSFGAPPPGGDGGVRALLLAAALALDADGQLAGGD